MGEAFLADDVTGKGHTTKGGNGGNGVRLCNLDNLYADPNGNSPPVIEDMNLVGDGNAGGNKVIDGHDDLGSAHVLAYLFLFVNEQDP